jgi:hypothetical protein
MKGKKETFKFLTILKVTDLIHTIFKLSEVQKYTRLNAYNCVALLTLSHGSEYWTKKAEEETSITAA